MALMNCHECNKQISTDAKVCPNCGAKVRPPNKKTSKVLLIGLALAAVWTVYLGTQNAEVKREAKNAEEQRQAALTPEQRAKEEADRARQAAQAAAVAASKAAEDQAREALLADRSSAEVTCKMAFERAANDPASVDWIREERQFSYTAADKSKAVSLQPVRARNGAGALVRRVSKCELVKANGNWTVQRLSEAR